jgi:hypothetical protein
LLDEPQHVTSSPAIASTDGASTPSPEDFAARLAEQAGLQYAADVAAAIQQLIEQEQMGEPQQQELTPPSGRVSIQATRG